MAIKITKTNKIQDHKLNIAVVGPSKTGKTHLIKTLPAKRILICNADKGTLTLADDDFEMVNINTFEEFIDFMKYVDKSKDFVSKGYDWVVFDSVSAIAKLLKTHMEKEGITGFDFWGEYLKILGGLCTTNRDTSRYHALSIFEITEKENSNGLLEKKVGLQGEMQSSAAYYFDYVFATKKVAGKNDKPDKYVLLTTNKDGYNFLGGRGANKLNPMEPSNLNHVIKKITSKAK